MIIAGVTLGITLLIFTIGKSPVFRVDRAGAAIIGAALIVGLGVLPFDQAILAVDFRTIVILFSMMVIIAYLKLAGFFVMVGNYVLRVVTTTRQLLVTVIFITGVLSALFINDIVCLLFTPVVIWICKRSKCDARCYLLAVALSSNVGSAATLIGNPQNIMIASLSGLSFSDYFYTAFPLVCMGLGLIYLILTIVYKQKDAKITYVPETFYCHQYLIIKTGMVMFLVLLGFVCGIDLAITSSLGAACLLLTRRVKPNKVYASIDFNLLIMFIGLFIIIGGVQYSGLMLKIMDVCSFLELNQLASFAAVTIIISNVFSNVPAVMLLQYFLPLENTEFWWKALAIFSTVAGNLTLTGSIANLIVVEVAKSSNIRIGFLEYFKAGFPVTLLLSFIGVIYLTVIN